MYELLIHNGTVVLPDRIARVDIAIQNGKIAAIGEYETLGDAASEYNAEGKYVLPGLIDPHVHMKHPFKEHFAPDDFFHASVSAAFGGTTTLIDFAIQWDKAVSIEDTVRCRRQAIEEGVVVDFALHATPTRSDQQTIDSVPGCLDLGVPSYKVYMVYRDQGRIVEDPIILGLLEAMRKRSALLMVHAENSSIAEYNRDKFVAEGRTAASYFPQVKPNFVEAEAISRAVFFNRVAESRLYIAHLSTLEGLEMVRSAQQSGEMVFCETCPHYLVLDADAYSRSDGQNFLCSPPLRSIQDRDALWQGIADGSISVISSDHCGFSLAQKALGQGDFSKTPNGLPGIETRLALVYSQGVLQERISIQQMVKVLSANPAKIFGMYPQKGAIQLGSDADLCIFDGTWEQTICASKLHGAVDWSPFEGMKVHGVVTDTILRGTFIVQDGQLRVQPGFGKFMHRQPAAIDRQSLK